MPYGEVAARSPAGASAGEGCQGTGPTAAMYGMAVALAASVCRGGRGGRQSISGGGRPFSWEIVGFGEHGNRQGEGGEQEQRRGDETRSEAAVIYVGRRYVWLAVPSFLGFATAATAFHDLLKLLSNDLLKFTTTIIPKYV